MTIMIPFSYSPSAILTYKYCPRKFQLKYIEKLSSRNKSKVMLDGITLHNYFELFYKEMPPIEEVTEEYFEEYRKKLPNYIKENFRVDIDNFLNFNYKLFSSTEKKFFKPLAVELKIKDEDLNFVGIIDCVFTDGKNILILDFKTGKAKDKIPEDYLFQLSAYIHLWNLHCPSQPITHIGLLYTKSSDTPVIIKVEKLHLDNMFKTIYEVKDKINNQIFPRTEKKYICQRCEMAEHCFTLEDLEKLQSEEIDENDILV